MANKEQNFVEKVKNGLRTFAVAKNPNKKNKKHQEQQECEKTYLKEMKEFLDRRGDREWDAELRAEYVALLVKHEVVSPEWKSKLRGP